MTIPTNPGWDKLLEMFDRVELEEVRSILSYSPKDFRESFVAWVRENRPRLCVCFDCLAWGSTVSAAAAGCMYIPCPTCKRGTWANLGVNCPAGMAVAFGSSRAIEAIQARDALDKLLDKLPYDYIPKLFREDKYRAYPMDMTPEQAFQNLPEGITRETVEEGIRIANVKVGNGWWEHKVGG